MFVIVVGGGNTGSQLAKFLLEAGHTVRVIEERPIVLEKLATEIPPEVVVNGDGSSPTVLEKAGIQNAQVLAAVTGSDETNLVVTSLGKFEFNVPRVIAGSTIPKMPGCSPRKWVWMFRSTRLKFLPGSPRRKCPWAI